MIARLTGRSDFSALWPQIEEIFFVSATVQAFADARARAAFLEGWMGYYRDVEPDNIFVALEPPHRVAGYLAGCFDSVAARRFHGGADTDHPFDDLFADYPAHFHVNCHPDFRNQGVGAALVEAFVAACVAAELPGVHIVTVAQARNVGFYRKCGLEFTLERRQGGRRLLLMGRRIRAKAVL